MIKLQIIPIISSGENGSIDQRGKSFYCVKLYTNSKVNRSGKRFSSKVFRSQSTCAKHDFEKRSEVFKCRNESKLNKGNSGRRRSIRTAENIEAVRDLLQQNFEKSNSRVHLTVWAAVCGNGLIIGPYFFHGNVNGNAYLGIQCLTTTACLHSTDSARYAQVHNALY